MRVVHDGDASMKSVSGCLTSDRFAIFAYLVLAVRLFYERREYFVPFRNSAVVNIFFESFVIDPDAK